MKFREDNPILLRHSLIEEMFAWAALSPKGTYLVISATENRRDILFDTAANYGLGEGAISNAENKTITLPNDALIKFHWDKPEPITSHIPNDWHRRRFCRDPNFSDDQSREDEVWIDEVVPFTEDDLKKLKTELCPNRRRRWPLTY